MSEVVERNSLESIKLTRECLSRRISSVEVIELQNDNGGMHANKPTINRIFTYLSIVC